MPEDASPLAEGGRITEVGVRPVSDDAETLDLEWALP